MGETGKLEGHGLPEKTKTRPHRVGGLGNRQQCGFTSHVLLALEYDEGIATVWLPLLVPLLMRVRVLDEADLSSHVSGARQEKMGDAMDVPAQ